MGRAVLPFLGNVYVLPFSAFIIAVHMSGVYIAGETRVIDAVALVCLTLSVNSAIVMATACDSRGIIAIRSKRILVLACRQFLSFPRLGQFFGWNALLAR